MNGSYTTLVLEAKFAETPNLYQIVSKAACGAINAAQHFARKAKLSVQAHPCGDEIIVLVIDGNAYLPPAFEELQLWVSAEEAATILRDSGLPMTASFSRLTGDYQDASGF